MAPKAGWLDRFVNDLPNKGWFGFLSRRVVIPYWVWRDPKPKLEGGPRPSPQPSEKRCWMIMPIPSTTKKSAVRSSAKGP